MRPILTPTLQKNDRKANILIISFSVFIFLVVSALHPLNKALHLDGKDFGFDVHIFALVNAIINTAVTLLLLFALWAVKQRRYVLHRNAVYVAMVLSILFLVSYITHHVLAGDTVFGGQGAIRIVYKALLYSHILLAAVILPFILFTAYRGLTGDYARHKKLARYTFPLWLYVSITGPLVYLMIAPYYH